MPPIPTPTGLDSLAHAALQSSVDDDIKPHSERPKPKPEPKAAKPRKVEPRIPLMQRCLASGMELSVQDRVDLDAIEVMQRERERGVLNLNRPQGLAAVIGAANPQPNPLYLGQTS